MFEAPPEALDSFGPFEHRVAGHGGARGSPRRLSDLPGGETAQAGGTVGAESRGAARGSRAPRLVEELERRILAEDVEEI